MGDVLQRAGLTALRAKKRVRTPPYAQPFAEVEQANQTWCADFKGWFRTGDGTRCDPPPHGRAQPDLLSATSRPRLTACMGRQCSMRPFTNLVCPR